jgi:peptidoglycan/xylan/chitin deacetylase (PgdA/CDA1 family)
MNLLGKISHRIRNVLVNKAVVLSYHRIIDTDFDPLNLAVSPKNFEQQLNILKDGAYNVLSVSDFLGRIKNGFSNDKTVCLTFDDGYKDNYLWAKPLLEKYNLPACFFMPTHYMDKQQAFWWDELADILFTSTFLQKTLIVNIRNEVFKFPIDEISVISDEQGIALRKWKRRDAATNKRTAAYRQLHQLLLPLSYNENQDVIRQLREQSNYESYLRKENLSMAKADLQCLLKNSLYEIGLHTATHTALGFHDRLLQRDEIAENKQMLEAIVNVPVNKIAYPNGSFNETTIDVLKEQQIAAAFTTKQVKVTKFSDSYQLGRYKVNNWDGPQFKQKLQEWFKN